jgi:hypothetical protein
MIAPLWERRFWSPDDLSGSGIRCLGLVNVGVSAAVGSRLWYYCTTDLGGSPLFLLSSLRKSKSPQERIAVMTRLLVAIVAVFAVASLSGCGSDWIGKGKGKAPPPVAAPAEPAPPAVYK